jgi:hypothetical protein
MALIIGQQLTYSDFQVLQFNGLISWRFFL